MQTRTAFASRPPSVRSRATNDPFYVFGLDGRSAEGRHLRDLILSFIETFGGVDVATDEEKSFARAAAFTIASSERVQSRILAGEDVDLSEASRLANLAARYRKDVRARQKARAEPAPTSPLAAHFANPPAREARG